MNRNGILAGGNFIIDHVKIIDGWPEQDMLANIRRETSSNGGGPYNVLKDLAAMKASFPLAAAGLVGDDANGRWILNDCTTAGIDTSRLTQTADAPTSYTDAMTVEGTGRRTFFHQRGANALLGEAHFDFSGQSYRWFHLGYLMLLDEMDRLLPDGRTVASKVLEKAKQADLITSVDIVSADDPHFREITLASLPYTDHLIINEIEAGKAAGLPIRQSDGGLEKQAAIEAARVLLEYGVSSTVVIHFVEGAVAMDARGDVTVQGSWSLPKKGFIVGATGAGDAFAAGYLHAMHDCASVPDALELAVTTAAACLTDPTPSGGLRPIPDCRSLVSGMSQFSL
ncbi:MAG: carbohydrate kinase family protein [Verrucomicrobiaceae bacterium]|nr:carbohydrate kinase family protein [Verrucomicrobiaceae bacterium]